MGDEVVFFATAVLFRAWLRKNHARTAQLVVGFHKVDTGRPSITWPESVDEALCFGWIDGVRKRIDEHSYQIRFSPRRASSIWSAVNVARMEALIAAGRVQPPGLAAYANRSAKKTGIYSFEQEQPVEFTPAEIRAFRKQARAWAYFDALPPGYRRKYTYWVVSAKKPETRAKRLAELMQACGEGRRLMK